MRKAALLALIILGQAAALLIVGVATLWWSEDLMTFLIHIVGEERALGARNVIRNEDGSTLLTNPGGMVLWMMPFWFLGCLQISSALTLVGLWVSRPTARRVAPAARNRGGEAARGRHGLEENPVSSDMALEDDMAAKSDASSSTRHPEP